MDIPEKFKECAQVFGILDQPWADEEDNIPEEIESSAINAWLFNRDTIKKLLEVLNDEDNASSPCFNWVVGESIFDSKFSSHEQLKNKALSLLSALTNKE